MASAADMRKLFHTKQVLFKMEVYRPNSNSRSAYDALALVGTPSHAQAKEHAHGHAERRRPQSAGSVRSTAAVPKSIASNHSRRYVPLESLHIRSSSARAHHHIPSASPHASSSSSSAMIAQFDDRTICSTMFKLGFSALRFSGQHDDNADGTYGACTEKVDVFVPVELFSSSSPSTSASSSVTIKFSVAVSKEDLLPGYNVHTSDHMIEKVMMSK